MCFKNLKAKDMKQKIMRLLLLMYVSVVCLASTAQNNKPVNPLTADSLATGNYKDILSSFFQLAFNRLTGPDKELRFTTNPYAVLAKRNPDLLIDTNYYKYRNLRKFNFSFAGKLDEAYQFNGFSSSVRYAIVNQRDYTISRAFVTSAFNANNEYRKLNSGLEAFISHLSLNDPLRKLLRDEKIKMQAKKGTVPFNQLDTIFQKVVKRIAVDSVALHFLKLLELEPALNVYKASQQSYDSLKKSFENKWLWTASVSDTTYTNQFLFSNVVLSTEVLKGILNPLRVSNLELNIRSAMHFVDDSTRAGRDLRRSVFSVEPGFNFVLKSKAARQKASGLTQSWLELKLSGAYNHTFSSLYTTEKRDSLTLNGTLRIRVYNDIWIPLEMVYDPRSGHVLGFLNVRFNFNTMGTLLRK